MGCRCCTFLKKWALSGTSRPPKSLALTLKPLLLFRLKLIGNGALITCSNILANIFFPLLFMKYFRQKRSDFIWEKKWLPLILMAGTLPKSSQQRLNQERMALFLEIFLFFHNWLASLNIVQWICEKTPEISDIVRIVQVEGFDSVACGGTHPEATGSVGLVKIIKTEPYKGGSRITFVCGSRALNIFSAMQHELLQSASLLSVGWSELGSAIESIQNESKHQKKIMKNLQIEWASLEAGRLVSGGSIINDVTIIQQQYDDIEPGQLQRLANTLKIIPGRIILLSAAKPSARVLLISTADHPDLSMKELLQDHIHYINGTGGGNKSSAQGGGVKTEGLSEMMSMMQQSVVSHLAQV
jgi:hypothetical protein